METNKLYRGRLIDHVQLVVSDIAKTKRFYAAVFETLAIPFGMQGDDYFQVDELFFSQKDSKHASGALTGRMHLAFTAQDEATVRSFYEVGLAAGGKDNGKPGERPYHPGYYAAFLIDPDGNNVEAVYHGPAKWSAKAIEITF